ncbi:MAG TPA: RNA polymerase factor sigma-32 [Polyangiaceae bacterium]
MSAPTATHPLPRQTNRDTAPGPKKAARKPKAERSASAQAASGAHTADEADRDGTTAEGEEVETEGDGEGEEAVADEAIEESEPETHEEDADGPVPSERTLRESSSIERFDALQVYLREVQRHPLLTPEQTQALSTKFLETQDPALAAQLVTANLRLVVKIAYEYRRAYKNIMDLIQEGNIGLMQAVKRYDPYRGVKLSSYAAWWIRAYILRFILNNWRLVKLGTTQAQRKLFFNLRKKRAELQAMGIDPTHEAIAQALNVPESEVADMDVRLQASEKSLDAPVGDAEGRSIAKVDMMPAAGDGPEALMADNELQGLLKDKLGEFRKTLVGKDKDLAIFDERLVADDPLTLQELGDRFGISRERVRQLEQRLTGKLREYLREEMGDAVDVV